MRSTREKSQRSKNAPTRYSPEDSTARSRHRRSREPSPERRAASQEQHRSPHDRRSRSHHSSRSHRSRSHSSRRSPQPDTSREGHNDTATLRQEVAEIRTTMTDIQEALSLFRQQSHNNTAVPSTSASTAPLPAENANYIELPMTATTPMTAAAASGNNLPLDPNDIIQMFRPTPRPVITSGVGITATVSPQLKEKIWRDEYVQLNQLLPQQSAQYSEAMTLALCPETQNQLGLRITKPKPATMTLQQWEDAFLVYMAVYTERHHVCPDMCTYMRDVKDMARRGGNFLHYDEQFRLERVATHCSWAALHHGLLIQAMTPFRAPQKVSTSQRTNSARVPIGYCHAYHARGAFCQTPKCRYKHSCPHCDERHPAHRCTNRQKANKGPVQNRPENSQQNAGTKTKQSNNASATK